MQFAKVLQKNDFFLTKYVSHVHCPAIVCCSQHMKKGVQFSAAMRQKTYRGFPP